MHLHLHLWLGHVLRLGHVLLRNLHDLSGRECKRSEVTRARTRESEREGGGSRVLVLHKHIGERDEHAYGCHTWAAYTGLAFCIGDLHLTPFCVQRIA